MNYRLTPLLLLAVWPTCGCEMAMLRPGTQGIGGTPAPAPPANPAAEQARIITDLNHRLAAVQANAQEDKRVYEARISQLEHLVLERDRALAQAQADIGAAAEEVARARAELQQWKQDMARLREQLRAAEKENVETLRALVAMMEKLAERSKP